MCKIGIYLVCDYPDRNRFFEAIEACEQYKIDFLEIGFPFSDPVADGFVIENAAMNVLKGKNTDDFFDSLKKVRGIFSNRLYIMTYANVVFGYKTEQFAKQSEFVDGIIIADLPFCESYRFDKAFYRYGTNIIRFVTPESSDEEIDKIKKNSKDFIYFVSIRGVTGSAFVLDDEIKLKIKRTRKDFDKDVILGFGIRNREDVMQACTYADGVVIGTKSIEALEQKEFEKFIKSLKI